MDASENENSSEEEDNIVERRDLIATSTTNVPTDYQRYSSLFVFAGGNKAGMEAMDKAKQAEVIYEMSKNSSFFKRAQQLDEEAEKRAEEMKKSFDTLVGPKLRRMEIIAENKLLDFEKKRSFEKICCVLDMDMFFAAVEIRDRPELKDLPVAVGGDAMISTSNYVARKYGVRAAMPGFIAKKLCPNLVFVHSNFDKYRVVSEQIKAVIGKVDPQYHSLSLDEVYFDLTNAAKERFLQENSFSMREPSVLELRAHATTILHEIRNEIKQITNGLTCSAGMAHNFFLAKICADVNKPDGQFELAPRRDAVLDFLVQLPTRKVGGIGKVMEKILDKLGMKTVGDIRQFIPHILFAFKPASSEFLTRISIGVADNEGHEVIQSIADGSVTRKSIGCERTYSAKGIGDRNELYRRLHEICVSLHQDMTRENLRGRAVTVKVKDIEFHLHTRCQTSRHLVGHTVESIESIAKLILDSYLPMKIRLLGVSVSKFDNAYDPHRNDPAQKQLKSAMESFLHHVKPNNNTDSNIVDDRRTLLDTESRHVTARESCDVIDLLEDSSSSNDEERFETINGEDMDTYFVGDDMENILNPDGEQSHLSRQWRDMVDSTLVPEKVQPSPSNFATLTTDTNKNNSELVKSEGKLDSDAICLESEDNEDAVCCPICQKQLPNDPVMANSHVDQCLNRSESGHKRSSSSQQIVSEIVRSKKPRTTTATQNINRFFTKK